MRNPPIFHNRVDIKLCMLLGPLYMLKYLPKLFHLSMSKKTKQTYGISIRLTYWSWNEIFWCCVFCPVSVLVREWDRLSVWQYTLFRTFQVSSESVWDINSFVQNLNLISYWRKPKKLIKYIHTLAQLISITISTKSIIESSRSRTTS